MPMFPRVDSDNLPNFSPATNMSDLLMESSLHWTTYEIILSYVHCGIHRHDKYIDDVAAVTSLIMMMMMMRGTSLLQQDCCM